MPRKKKARPEPAVVDLKVHACTQCGETMTRDGYWNSDWGGRACRCISCKVCQPIPPNERCRVRNEGTKRVSILSHQCTKCMTEKPRDEFWSTDLRHRLEYSIKCKDCQPTPPGERRPVPKDPTSKTKQEKVEKKKRQHREE